MELEVLHKDRFYHIFNRGINKEPLFLNRENKLYFLLLLKKHLNNHCQVLAYCLMDNHFHLLIRFTSEGNVTTQALSNFFNAYAKAFNKYSGRSGSLFEKHFRRIELYSEAYLRNLIVYIHRNPATHFNLDFRSYDFSSYGLWTMDDPQIVHYKKQLFDSAENFEFVHTEQPNILNQPILE